MLIIMAVNAKQLPVTAIKWIVVVIEIFVMNRQFAHSFAFKLTTTPPADMREHFKRPHTIASLPDFHFASQVIMKLNVSFRRHKGTMLPAP